MTKKQTLRYHHPSKQGLRLQVLIVSVKPKLAPIPPSIKTRIKPPNFNNFIYFLISANTPSSLQRTHQGRAGGASAGRRRLHARTCATTHSGPGGKHTLPQNYLAVSLLFPCCSLAAPLLSPCWFLAETLLKSAANST